LKFNFKNEGQGETVHTTGTQSRSKIKILNLNNFGPERDIDKIQTLVFIVFYGLLDPIKT